MTQSYTITESRTFTVTHARHMAAKVAADLKRMQRFYGEPSDSDTAEYEEEVTSLIRDGYLGVVWYGYKRDGEWIEPTLRYTAHELADQPAPNDDPGKVRPSKDTTGATFYSFLEYSGAWSNLTQSEQEQYKANLPFQRVNGSTSSVHGYLENDRVYSSGGRSLNRASVRSY